MPVKKAAQATPNLLLRLANDWALMQRDELLADAWQHVRAAPHLL